MSSCVWAQLELKDAAATETANRSSSHSCQLHVMHQVNATTAAGQRGLDPLMMDAALQTYGGALWWPSAGKPLTQRSPSCLNCPFPEENPTPANSPVGFFSAVKMEASVVSLRAELKTPAWK